MEIKYYKDAKHNYLIVDVNINDDNLFQYRMLENNEIEGLLPFSLRNMDGQYKLYYEMDSKQSIKNKYIRQKMDYEKLKSFLGDFIQTAKNLGDYLLDPGHIVLSPETIFEEFSSGKYYFTYDPSIEKMFDRSFIESLMEYVEMKDDRAQDLLYKLLDSFYDEGVIDYNYLKSLISVDDQKIQDKDCYEDNRIVTATDINDFENDYKDEDFTEDKADVEKKKKIRLPINGNIVMGILFAIVAGILWYFRYAYNLTYEENLLDIAVFMVSVMMSLTSFLLFIRKSDKCHLKNQTSKEKSGNNIIPEIAENRVEKAKEYRRIAEKKYEDFPEYDEEGEETVMLSLDFGKQTHKLYAIDDTEHESISLGKLPIVIGKLASCSDVVIKDKTISRMHARIYKPEPGNDNVWIQDLNSTNGTFINGRRMMPNEKIKLCEDDEISFGKCVFAYR
ncbi:DUF6382 domain-containing protein [Butyrivibrio sp. AE3004]|uniref:DUF6382 domain-containing protein n=1 Tax=Butyrivibrio sp. AE3004 TaxID=1506994 RepID=UPI000493FAEB|nr:DUF6382 domain-containing protein [Butyrivibrio sp. AE3004]